MSELSVFHDKPHAQVQVSQHSLRSESAAFRPSNTNAAKAASEASRCTSGAERKSLIPPQGQPLASVQIALTIQDSQFVLLDTYDVRPTRRERALDSDTRRSRSHLSEREAMWSDEDEDEGDDDDWDVRARRGRSEDGGGGEDAALVALACSDQEEEEDEDCGSGSGRRSRAREASVDATRSAANMVYGARCALVLRATSTLNLFLALRALQPDPPDAPVLREPPWPLEVSLSRYELQLRVEQLYE